MAGVLVAVVVFDFIPQGNVYVTDSDRKIYDRIIRSGGGPQEREDFVLLGVDEASLAPGQYSEEDLAESEVLQLMDGVRFPWDRRVWAAAIDRLCQAGAKLVVLDFYFTEPSDNPQADDAMAAAIARYPEKIILVSALAPIGQNEVGDDVYTLVEPYVQFLESDPEPRYGFANFWPDPNDGSTRSVLYRTGLGEINGHKLTGEPQFLSLAGQIMDVYGADIPEGHREIRFTSSGDSPDLDVYRPRSVSGLFSKKEWEINYGSGSFFKDKVVIIGPVASRFQDIHETPLGKITGPQLHLHTAACGLAQAYVYHFGHPLLMMSLLGLLAAAIAGSLEKTRNSAIAIMLLLAGFAFGVWWLGKIQSIMVPVTGGLIVAAVGWTTAQVYQLVRERLEKGRIRSSFRRFVSRDVVDRLVDQPEAWAEIAAGRKRPVVVLFSDVRGFTSRSETAEPTELVEQLNEYFSAMVAIVFRHEGTLDKFIGDAVMAHWGAIDDDSDGDHARRALAAAKEMMEELAELNEAWEKKGWAPFQMGIGVHLGEAVSGEIGSADRIEFSVIGDAVNLASRLEGLTKPFCCDIVFSDTVHEAAQPEGAKALGKVRVKGRSGAVELYGYGDEAKIKAALDSMDRDAKGAIVMTSK